MNEPVILAHGRVGQEDCFDFEGSLEYKVSFWLEWAT